jgi:hypothetical protein
MVTKVYISFDVERKTSLVIKSGSSAICILLTDNIECFDSIPTGVASYNVDGRKAIDAVLALFAAVRLQQSLIGFSPEDTVQTITKNVIVPLAIPSFSLLAA